MVWVFYRRSESDLSDRYATFWPRFWSCFVDALVLWPVGFLATATLLLPVPRFLAALIVVMECFLWLVYAAQMHARYGQTIGKMATKVRVVDCGTEQRITLGQAWLREGIPVVLGLGALIYQLKLIFTTTLEPHLIMSGAAIDGDAFMLLSMLPAAWLVLDTLTMLTNQKSRSLHDYIAGTVVVRTNIKLHALPQSA